MGKPLTATLIDHKRPKLKLSANHLFFNITKRIADLVLGVTAFVLALPVLAVCAAIIRLSGKCSPIYTQTRVIQDV